MNLMFAGLALAALPPTLPQDPRPGPGRSDRTQAPGRFEQPGVRSIDGTGNNLEHAEWGSANAALTRRIAADYEDGVGSPSGADRPSAREISNAVVAQAGDVPNALGVSDFFWQWGQFLDHDITLTPELYPIEAFDIEVPLGDPWFDPYSTGVALIPLGRSYYEYVDGQREQFNELTAWIDGSNVYGSDDDRALALRTLDGTGRLKTSAGDRLPYNEEGLPNAPSTAPDYFLAGDVRANEQVGLTVMHTLFVREHNYWADRLRAEAERDSGFEQGDLRTRDGRARVRQGELSARRGRMSGEQIYQRARAIVSAEIQVITYREFLPLLLGPSGMEPYQGYRDSVQPDIRNEFATAAYRFGHSMLSPTLLRIDAEGRELRQGHLSLAQAFFAPAELEVGLEPYLRGLAVRRAQEVDPLVIDELRNLLFGPPGAGGLDLAALNIQRGRDHGLAGYAEARLALGLPPALTFAAISSDPAVQARLASVYSGPDQVDLWVGGLAEDKLPGAMVGRTFHRILSEQFRALRDGDRYWYERSLPGELVELVERQSLAAIIRRNTRIGDELQDNVFLVD